MEWVVEILNEIGPFVLIGFFAQLIGSALGMAYGVLSSSFLLNFGITPAVASASIHIAEIFTSGISGIAHFKIGNVNKELFKKLLFPGMLGALIGALTLSVFNSNALSPFIAIFLLIMGIRIIIKAFRYDRISKSEKESRTSQTQKFIIPLALVGGLFDATGGGWGPIVTSTLLANGENPRQTIGSVNAAEFFVTLVQVIVFIAFFRMSNWHIIVGLLIGGAISAPIGAQLVKKIPAKIIMYIAGILICAIQLRTLYLAWF